MEQDKTIKLQRMKQEKMKSQRMKQELNRKEWRKRSKKISKDGTREVRKALHHINY